MAATLKERKELTEYFLNNERFIKHLSDILQIEADGGDSPESFLRWALEEAWREMKISRAEYLHEERMKYLHQPSRESAHND